MDKSGTDREAVDLGHRLRLLLIVMVVVAVVGVAGVVLAWALAGWTLAKAQIIGDASAPIVGLFSLAALLVAVFSVLLQIVELQAQRHEMRESSQALRDQVDEQRRLLQLQLDEVDWRRKGTLREIYARWFAAATNWLRADGAFASVGRDLFPLNGIVAPSPELRRAAFDAYCALMLVDVDDSRLVKASRIMEEFERPSEDLGVDEMQEAFAAMDDAIQRRLKDMLEFMTEIRMATTPSLSVPLRADSPAPSA